MDQSSDSLSVKQVSGYPAVGKPDALSDRNPRRHRREKKRRNPQKLADYFPTLAKAAEVANAKLVSQGKPMRFRISREGDKVFIETVAIDSAGMAGTISRKEITDDDFARWIEDITAMEGLVIDREG